MKSRFWKNAWPLLPVFAFCGYLVLSTMDGGYSADTGNTMTDPMMLSRSTVDETATGPLSRVSLPELPHPPVIGKLVPPPELPRPVAAPVRPAAVKRPYRLVDCLVTAYCPCSRCCGRHADGITSTGTSAWSKGVAADPRVLYYGTKVYVEGYGFALVDDTGGAMRKAYRYGKRPHIDLRMSSHWKAQEWGRQIMKVRVYTDSDE